MYTSLHAKYLLFCRSNINFLDIISKDILLSNLRKNPSSGGDLFHADGQTDMSKLIVAFRDFAIAPKSKSVTT
jgi:hypothetical protein